MMAVRLNPTIRTGIDPYDRQWWLNAFPPLQSACRFARCAYLSSQNPGSSTRVDVGLLFNTRTMRSRISRAISCYSRSSLLLDYQRK